MKKLLIGTVAVFVFFELYEFLVHGVILKSTYESLSSLWRPDMMDKMYVIHIIALITAFFFTLIFDKGREGKGVMEGVRYGFYMGMILAVGMAYGSYSMYPIPYSLALQWFLYGLVEYVIAGVVVAYVYQMKDAAPAA